MKKLMILSALAVLGVASWLYANQDGGAVAANDCPKGCCTAGACCVK